MLFPNTICAGRTGVIDFYWEGMTMGQTEFRTLTGYRQAEDKNMTEAMEDYLEMIYRTEGDGGIIRVSDLAAQLHVRPSSASRMVTKLAEGGFLRYEKYGVIRMTEAGRAMGEYLLWRHDVLHRFFCKLNGTDNELTQVEQVEHFMSEETVRNLERLTQGI